MSTSDFDEILKQIDQLSGEQREELISRLEQTRNTIGQANGRSTESLLDVFEKRGIVGSIKDAPADWSSNPDHMNGFGEDDQ